MLVHEPKRMHELVHGHDQPLTKAGGVEVHRLLPTSHPQLAFAVLAMRVYCDIVGARAGGWLKRDTWDQLGDVVHCLPHQCPQGFLKKKN